MNQLLQVLFFFFYITQVLLNLTLLLALPVIIINLKIFMFVEKMNVVPLCIFIRYLEAFLGDEKYPPSHPALSFYHLSVLVEQQVQVSQVSRVESLYRVTGFNPSESHQVDQHLDVEGRPVHPGLQSLRRHVPSLTVEFFSCSSIRLMSLVCSLSLLTFIMHLFRHS